MQEPTILIVEDEADLANLLKISLQKEGYQQITIAGTIQEAWTSFQQIAPNIVLLDVMLPDGEGYDLCRRIREVSHVPVLFMSAKTEEIDKIVGLAIGGDDYITKPFSPKEVAYRVKAQLRRAGYQTQDAPPSSSEKAIQVGPFQLNTDETEVQKDGVLLELTAKEIGLMACFMRNPNRILSKETLFERVWGEDFFGSDNTVMVHIRRLREKIEQDASRPMYITTVKGLGYKLVIPQEAQR
ncbi:response regulator transcription factor [Lysinibacillus macroides]|uniref:Transcriptional regulator n=1 Tax=Lysinibacillus macroides TaxID=33935 RepID=A0A0M9DM86_9BACI|nr:response regulator transcription factor [Lysinibacillus macroides]KOY83779.1 transcriptional regulator [Lysinibacillus macroides]QPR67043.1 response regulator transcription factor [Lysinibacillus macroides]